MAPFVDEALLQDFLADSDEHLNAIEPDLLALESDGASVDQEVINRVFRAIHSIKGFSVFLGFEKVTELSHAMEHLLMRLRDGVISSDPDKVDALLAGADKLRAMIQDIEASDQVSCQSELEQLRAASTDDAASPQADPKGQAQSNSASGARLGRGGIVLQAPGGPARVPVAFALESSQLGQVVERDLSLYAVWVDIQQDLTDRGRKTKQLLADLDSCGQRLVCDVQDAVPGAGLSHCLFATLIEEPEIVSAALELPLERLFLFPKEEVRDALRSGGTGQSLTDRVGAAGAPATETVLVADGDVPEGRGIAFAASAAELAAAREQELHLFAVWVHCQRDLVNKSLSAAEFLQKLATCGRCLDTDLTEALASGQAYGHCLLASIIEELEIAAMALDLPEDQVRPLPAGTVSQPEVPPPGAPADVAPPTKGPAPAPIVQEPPPLKTAATHIETIRVNVPLVDKLINLAGELVLGRNQLRRLIGEMDLREPLLGSVLQNVDLITSEMQENVMTLRMQPVSSVFNKFPRVVRDLSRQLAKEVELSVMGGEVELDKSILEQLSDPLTHLVRNCVDHGIEAPEERLKLGKPRKGRIVLKAFHEEGLLNITISDDGRGIDAEAVAQRAVAAGKIKADEVERLGHSEKLNLIALPGVSTAKQVTDISGRGVGMDVVATNLQKINGHLQIDSELGAGSCMHMRLPLTLAIIPSLLVGANGEVFAIPQVDVQELLCIQSQTASQRIEMVGDAPVVRLREKLLPLVRLRDVLGLSHSFVHPHTNLMMEDRRLRLADRRQAHQTLEPDQPDQNTTVARRTGGERRRRRADDIFVVVLRLGGNRYGLVVDELFDAEEIVVKPLSRHIKDCRCFGGTTILGDGSVAMILSAAGIADHAKLRFSEIQAEDSRRAEELRKRKKTESGPTVSLVVFQYTPDQYFAMLLGEVARLEMISPELIQLVGGRECVQYRDAGLDLLRLENHLPVGRYPRQSAPMYLIIPKNGDHQVGIVAYSIVDIIETDAAVREYQGPHRGLAGMINLQGRLTMILDGHELIEDFRQGRRAVEASPVEPGMG